MAVGVYRYWYEDAATASGLDGIYGKLSNVCHSHGGVLDWLAFGKAVAQCIFGEEDVAEEIRFAFQTKDGKWHDYTSFDEGSD